MRINFRKAFALLAAAMAMNKQNATAVGIKTQEIPPLSTTARPWGYGPLPNGSKHGSFKQNLRKQRKRK